MGLSHSVFIRVTKQPASLRVGPGNENCGQSLDVIGMYKSHYGQPHILQSPSRHILNKHWLILFEVIVIMWLFNYLSKFYVSFCVETSRGNAYHPYIEIDNPASWAHEYLWKTDLFCWHTFNDLIIFILFIWTFDCTSVRVTHLNNVHGSQKRYQVPCNWSYKCLCGTMRVHGTKIGSYATAAGALRHWAISLISWWLISHKNQNCKVYFL